MSEFNLSGINAEDFPQLPTVEYQNSFSIPEGTLRSMISQTLFAVSQDESRPVHTGSLFVVEEDDKFTLVAVDGFRILIRGRSSHVSNPQLGVDALYIGSHIVTALQAQVTRRTSPVEPVILGIGSFHSGT